MYTARNPANRIWHSRPFAIRAGQKVGNYLYVDYLYLYDSSGTQYIDYAYQSPWDVTSNGTGVGGSYVYVRVYSYYSEGDYNLTFSYFSTAGQPGSVQNDAGSGVDAGDVGSSAAPREASRVGPERRRGCRCGGRGHWRRLGSRLRLAARARRAIVRLNHRPREPPKCISLRPEEVRDAFRDRYCVLVRGRHNQKLMQPRERIRKLSPGQSVDEPLGELVKSPVDVKYRLPIVEGDGLDPLPSSNN